MTDDAPAPRQTLSFVKSLLDAHGLRAKNKLGQNFLIDLNLIDLVTRSADLQPADLVLEVGTGTGSLSTRLAAQAAALLTVEIDPLIAEIAREQLAPFANARLLRGDALKNKNELNPEIFAALDDLRARHACQAFKLVANLPYAVATPVMTNLLLGRMVPDACVVTVQWEIAERLLAAPGRSAYGALAVLVQSLGEVELIRRLPPSVFWPRPKVDSAILRILPRADRRAAVTDAVGSPIAWRHFLRDLYVHRRKILRSALAGWPRGARDRAAIDALLERLEISPTLRAEELDVADHLRLAQAFLQLPPA